MTDLFSSEGGLVSLGIPEADVRLQRVLPALGDPDGRFQALLAETPWRQESITLYGRTLPQPRLVAWYGDGGYSYSGLILAPLPWTPTLLAVKAAVEAAAGSSFNAVLLNLYRDHRDSVGMHSDDEPELGPTPVIASVSLGADRTFVLEHKRTKERHRVELAAGSLLLMVGETQRHWRHGVPKQSRPAGARINLTFRQIRNH